MLGTITSWILSFENLWMIFYQSIPFQRKWLVFLFVTSSIGHTLVLFVPFFIKNKGYTRFGPTSSGSTGNFQNLMKQLILILSRDDSTCVILTFQHRNRAHQAKLFGYFPYRLSKHFWIHTFHTFSVSCFITINCSNVQCYQWSNPYTVMRKKKVGMTFSQNLIHSNARTLFLSVLN